MKIHAFKLDQLGTTIFEDVVRHIQALPLVERLRDIDGSDMRLEEANINGPIWMLDFVNIRHEGPGRASADMPITDFDMEDHEGFGQETGVCFDTGTTRAFILQYNHYGPRLSRLQSYLFKFSAEIAGFDAYGPDEQRFGISLTPIIKGEAADRLREMNIVKTIDISINVPGILASQQQNRREALGHILEDPLIISAETMKLQLAVSRARGKTLSVRNVMRMAQDLIGVRDDVTKIEIGAMESEDAPREPLDLLQARLEADIPVRQTGRRPLRQDRWAVLRQAYDTWLANHHLS